MSTLTLCFYDGEEIVVHGDVLADSIVLQSMANIKPVKCFDDNCIVDPRRIADYLRTGDKSELHLTFNNMTVATKLNELHQAYIVARHFQICALETFLLYRLNTMPEIEGEASTLVENADHLYDRDLPPDLSYRVFFRTALRKCFVKSSSRTWNEIRDRQGAMKRAEFTFDVYIALWGAQEGVTREWDTLNNQWDDTMYAQTYKKAAPKRPVILSSSGSRAGHLDIQAITLEGQVGVKLLDELVEMLQKTKEDLVELRKRWPRLMQDLQVKHYPSGE